MNLLGSVARWVGYVGLLTAAIVALAACWLVLKVVTYRQVEDPEALARKTAELERMADAGRVVRTGTNAIIILFDDLGYGDLGAFGSRALSTPNIDRIAAEGIALDHFYSAAPVCTPSRAGLLTGRWPVRTTLTRVVFPTGHPFDYVLRALGRPVRLPADEITVADALHAGGYATAMVGKWHLGDRAPSLPLNLGFDHYLGLLYSNDMSPTDLWHDDKVILPDPVDQTTLTPRYTAEAIQFIESNRDRPFFLYFAHTFPHQPLHATAQQQGRSDAGLYGDVIADLDRSVGQVLDTLKQLDIDDRTLIIVTSDNGPWFQGSPGGVRGRKGDTFEGGMRVPFLARWPGRIPAGVRSSVPAAAVDILPTVLTAAGMPRPGDRIIDGVDLTPLLTGIGEMHERSILYFADRELRAVRVGRYKWVARRGIAYDAPETENALSVVPLLTQGPWLFDLEADPDESYDIRARQPAVYQRLKRIAGQFDHDQAINPRGWR